jgi:hypothetical protein
MKPAAQSIDANQGGKPVAGSTVTLKEPIGCSGRYDDQVQ